MPRKTRPWPVAEMLDWYSSGLSTGEIAIRLGSPEWQAYWVGHSGTEFHPHKVTVCVVLRQSGCQIRSACERSKGRHPALKPWPIQQMIDLYRGGMTLEELASHLSSEEWQSYWIEKTGAEYHPGQKIVNKVLKKRIQLRGHGSPGSRNGSWKGGRRVDKDGYRLTYSPDHPMAASNGCVREHRLVMERTLGRYLTAVEVVHHKDDDKSNNHPDNLELFENNAAHISTTTTGKKNHAVGRSCRRSREMERQPALQDARDRLIRKLHKEGATTGQIGEIFQIHDNTVARLLARLECSGRPLKRADVPDRLREECRQLLATLDQSIADARA